MQAFNTTSLTPPPSNVWYMNSGASAHMTGNQGNLSHLLPPWDKSIKCNKSYLPSLTSLGWWYALVGGSQSPRHCGATPVLLQEKPMAGEVEAVDDEDVVGVRPQILPELPLKLAIARACIPRSFRSWCRQGC
jgi:hypothetical protein